MIRTNRNMDSVIYILLAVLLIFGWHTACGLPYNSGDASLPVSFNLLLYVLSVSAVCLAACAAFLLTDLVRRKVQESSAFTRFMNVLLAPVFLFVVIGIFLLIYRVYTNENTLFPGNAAGYSLRQYFPHPIYFLFMLIPALLLYITGASSLRSSRLLRAFAAFIVSLLSALYAYCPNPFADSGSGILHIDAYTTSIINTARLIPYDSHHISIYGHHGILYLPLVRLFGGNFRAVTYAICVFTFISFFAASYTADVLLEKDLVYTLTVFSILTTTTLLTRVGVYFQINPHRLLFPMLALALLAYESKHPKSNPAPVRVILRLLISSLAFVWNFETGLFVAVTLALCTFMRDEYDIGWFTLTALRRILMLAFFIALSFGMAVGIVDLYNFTVGGGPVTLKQFVYPFFSGVYSVSHLRLSLPSVGHLYFLQILLFGFSLLSLLRGRMDAQKDSQPIYVLIAGIALSGLSALIYFINRPTYGNMSIAFIQMCLIAGFYADRFMDRKKLTENGFRSYRFFRYLIGAVLFFSIFWISVESILYLNQGLSIRQINSWDMKEEQEVIEEIKKVVPENTTAFGLGVPQLYYELGWDPQIYPMDFADINTENQLYLRESIKDIDACLTTNPDYVPEGLTLSDSFVIRNSEFFYYKK